ncbi:hypothetical protein PG989_005836 [Apiospora arundinis]
MNLHYDIALWQVHDTEDDCDLIIRTDNGRAFYCQISPSRFQRSPKILEQYLKCVNILRSGEEEIDQFYEEDAYEWLTKPFEPLITKLSPSTLRLPRNQSPTLSQYLYPPYFVCSLEATDEKMQATRLENQTHGWSEPFIAVDDPFISDLNSWTQIYHPSDVELRYDRPQDTLIKRPTKVAITDEVGGRVTCFFKRFELSFGPAHAKREIMTLKTIAQIPGPPEAWVCRLRGVVKDRNYLIGMLFSWINIKGPLSETRAAQSSIALRRRWIDQITRSVTTLHQNHIIWGDAKAGNVLVDEDDNAWIVDFGGSYTDGWVDPRMAGTVAGDEQGLARIWEALGGRAL